ncbi:MAG: hypothetical protein ACLT98_15740 [Eggerthellaceae bacterium]
MSASKKQKCALPFETLDTATGALYTAPTLPSCGHGDAVDTDSSIAVVGQRRVPGLTARPGARYRRAPCRAT